MGLGNLFKSLFGSGSSAENKGVSSTAADAVEYNGFTIVAEPINDGGQYRTAGTISKLVNGEQRETRFIRADNNGDHQASVDHCLYKAKQIIDEQGESIFDREMVWFFRSIIWSGFACAQIA